MWASPMQQDGKATHMAIFLCFIPFIERFIWFFLNLNKLHSAIAPNTQFT